MNIEQKNALFTYKIVLIGAGGVGKTCLFNRFCFNSFDLNTLMTIGINFHTTYLPLKFRDYEGDHNEYNEENYYVVDSIFDFSGQERFRPLIPQFLEGASGALLIFDSVNFSSFVQLDEWYNLLIKNADPNIPKLLIGSKSDLLDKIPKAQIVSEDVILDYVKEKNLDGFYRTSALTNYNVLEVFKKLTNLILEYNEINAYVE
ncbi:MAG: Rab family GTPase [Promethearchaeota archaeon]